jgi:AraC-like DNA-binding protein
MKMNAGSDRPPTTPVRGVLELDAPKGQMRHRRLSPSIGLADSIAHHWSVSWALDAPFTASTVPHPSVHLLFEEREGSRRAEIAGVQTGRFERELSGRGAVFGIKFRPAAFQPLLGRALSELTDRVIPLTDLFGDKGRACSDAIFEELDFDRQVAAAEEFLAPLLRPLEDEICCDRDLVERMAVDRSILRVDQIAAAAGVEVRTLQRRFRRNVGVSPKWVIQRYRLHEAAERLKARPTSLADMAAALGYADQAHFARDFQQIVGCSPGAYARLRPPG